MKRFAWFALCVAAACSSKPPEDTRDYATRIASDRAAKDEYFKGLTDPIPDARKAELLPLAYFPIDPSYDVPASLTPSDDTTVQDMQTSTGAPRKMRIAGTLTFSLKGTGRKLVSSTTALMKLTSSFLVRPYSTLNDSFFVIDPPRLTLYC